MTDAKVELVAVLREALAFVEEIEARDDTHYLIGGKISEQIAALEQSDAVLPQEDLGDEARS